MVEGSIYELAARQLLRAMRGERSQRVLSRRLGYRGNPITDWEAGRSEPTMAEALRVAQLSNLPVYEAFERLSGVAPVPPCGAVEVAAWLNSLRGSTAMTDLAERVGASRHAVRRWLSAATHIKVSDFLHVVDALTGRTPDLVGAMVDIRQVPSLCERFERMQLAKRVAFDVPWTEAVLRVLETRRYKEHEHGSDEFIAEWLQVDLADVQVALSKMIDAGIVQRVGRRYESVGTLSVDVRTKTDGLRAIKRHWLGVLAKRATIQRPRDWFGYNVMSVSATDLELIRERMQSLFKEIRGTVSASEPAEEVGFVMLQLVHWTPPTTD